MADLSQSYDPPQAGNAPPETPVRRLYRLRTDRVLGGVCSGLGRYLNVDPVLLRVAAVALALSGGFGLVAYIVAWIVIPEEAGEEQPDAEQLGPRAPVRPHGVAVAVGAGLIAIGALMLFRDVLPWFGWAVFWPIVVVGVGIFIVISARR